MIIVCLTPWLDYKILELFPTLIRFCGKVISLIGLVRIVQSSRSSCPKPNSNIGINKMTGAIPYYVVFRFAGLILI